MDRRVNIGGFAFSMNEEVLIDPTGTVVHLRKKTIDVLKFLASNADQIVSRDTIFDAVWAGVHVTDDNLTQCIAEIRRTLAPTAQNRLKTVHGRGFRLVTSPEKETGALDKLKPMIAVFPFTIIGDENSSLPIRDLVVDDLTQNLARSEILSVISSLSARRFAESETWNDDIRTSAGVDYVLRGSIAVQSESALLRIELIDVENLHVIWSDVTDCLIADIVHDIAALIRVTSMVHRAVLGAELRKERSLRLTDLKRHTVFATSLDFMHNEDDGKFQKARSLLVSLEGSAKPEPVLLAANGQWQFYKAVRTPDFESVELVRQSQLLAEASLSMDPNCILALSVMASSKLALDGDASSARHFFQRALSFNPNAYKERLLMGVMDAYDGRTVEGLANTEAALKLAANHPYNAHLLYIATGAFIAAADYERATELIDESLNILPNFPPAIRLKLITEALGGNRKNAKALAQRLLELDPNTTVTGWRRLSMIGQFPVADTFAEALREAGIPDA